MRRLPIANSSRPPPGRIGWREAVGSAEDIARAREEIGAARRNGVAAADIGTANLTWVTRQNRLSHRENFLESRQWRSRRRWWWPRADVAPRARPVWSESAQCG